MFPQAPFQIFHPCKVDHLLIEGCLTLMIFGFHPNSKVTHLMWSWNWGLFVFRFVWLGEFANSSIESEFFCHIPPHPHKPSPNPFPHKPLNYLFMSIVVDESKKTIHHPRNSSSYLHNQQTQNSQIMCHILLYGKAIRKTTWKKKKKIALLFTRDGSSHKLKIP